MTELLYVLFPFNIYGHLSEIWFTNPITGFKVFYALLSVLYTIYFMYVGVVVAKEIGSAAESSLSHIDSQDYPPSKKDALQRFFQQLSNNLHFLEEEKIGLAAIPHFDTPITFSTFLATSLYRFLLYSMPLVWLTMVCSIKVFPAKLFSFAFYLLTPNSEKFLNSRRPIGESLRDAFRSDDCEGIPLQVLEWSGDPQDPLPHEFDFNHGIKYWWELILINSGLNHGTGTTASELEGICKGLGYSVDLESLPPFDMAWLAGKTVVVRNGNGDVVSVDPAIKLADSSAQGGWVERATEVMGGVAEASKGMKPFTDMAWMQERRDVASGNHEATSPSDLEIRLTPDDPDFNAVLVEVYADVREMAIRLIAKPKSWRMNAELQKAAGKTSLYTRLLDIYLDREQKSREAFREAFDAVCGSDCEECSQVKTPKKSAYVAAKFGSDDECMVVSETDEKIYGPDTYKGCDEFIKAQIDAAGSSAGYENVRIAYVPSSGPDFPDGHDCEGFKGGCERMGCPGGILCTEAFKRPAKSADCGCREGECESKPEGCRIAKEVEPARLNKKLTHDDVTMLRMEEALQKAKHFRDQMYFYGAHITKLRDGIIESSIPNMRNLPGVFANSGALFTSDAAIRVFLRDKNGEFDDSLVQTFMEDNGIGAPSEYRFPNVPLMPVGEKVVFDDSSLNNGADTSDPEEHDLFKTGNLRNQWPSKEATAFLSREFSAGNVEFRSDGVSIGLYPKKFSEKNLPPIAVEESIIKLGLLDLGKKFTLTDGKKPFHQVIIAATADSDPSNPTEAPAEFPKLFTPPASMGEAEAIAAGMVTDDLKKIPMNDRDKQVRATLKDLYALNSSKGLDTYIYYIAGHQWKFISENKVMRISKIPEGAPVTYIPCRAEKLGLEVIKDPVYAAVLQTLQVNGGCTDVIFKDPSGEMFSLIKGRLARSVRPQELQMRLVDSFVIVEIETTPEKLGYAIINVDEDFDIKTLKCDRSGDLDHTCGSCISCWTITMHNAAPTPDMVVATGKAVLKNVLAQMAYLQDDHPVPTEECGACRNGCKCAKT